VLDILSSISGHFTKPLILGTFLPVIIFVILCWLLVIPLFPVDWSFLKPLEALEIQWKVLVILFFTIILTGLLYSLNIPIIRLYEGYHWKDLWIGEWRTEHYRHKFRAVYAQWVGLPILEYDLFDAGDPRHAEVNRRLSEVGRELNNDFPGEERLVLPTRLGNVIRSFEHYADRQYGMDTVMFWPRLAANISKEYAVAIDDTRAWFDFMLNGSLLSTILTLTILLAGLLYSVPLTSPQWAILWIAESVFFGALAFFLYFSSIGRAAAWGNLVKSAFDMYRWDALKQLGYTRAPATMAEERIMWGNISSQLIFGDYYRTSPEPYFFTTTSADGMSNLVKLEIGRGISLPTPAGEMVVTLQVRNVGDNQAENVIVTDSLPNDFVYVWNSLVLDHPTAPATAPQVVGANPYRFTVGPLAPGAELTLEYRAVSLKKFTGGTP
jgi:uncharacterized repeat protein (TIGR01451 family)